MKQTPLVIIIVLLVAFVITRECDSPNHVPEPIEIVIRDTAYLPGDSIPVPYDSIIIKDRWHFELVEVPTDVDTAAILSAYFAKVQGRDTLANDSSVFVAIDWQVSQNRLNWVIPTIQNRRKTAIINNTSIIKQPKPKNKYFAGLGTGRSLTSFGLAPSLALLNRKDNLYSFHYDVLHKEVYITMYWKIR